MSSKRRRSSRLSDREADRKREYVKAPAKTIQTNLVYPDEGRRAGLQRNATVSSNARRGRAD